MKAVTSDDLRAVLARLGVSQTAAANDLDITDRSMRRYCSGEVAIPRTIMIALHLIEFALRDERQRKWLIDNDVHMAYVRQDGSDMTLTKQEIARLGERAGNFRKHAKKTAASRKK